KHTSVVVLLVTVPHVRAGGLAPSPFWGVPGPVLVYQRPIEAMVDVTNDLGVAVLQDFAYTRSNFAFSPYGVASVLVVLYEGARGESARQIHNTLRLPWNRDITRIGFRDIHRHLRSYFSHEGYLSGLTLNKNRTSLLVEYRRVLRFYGYDVGTGQGEQFPPTTTKKPTTTNTETTITENIETTSSIRKVTTEDIIPTTSAPEAVTEDILLSTSPPEEVSEDIIPSTTEDIIPPTTTTRRTTSEEGFTLITLTIPREPTPGPQADEPVTEPPMQVEDSSPKEMPEETPAPEVLMEPTETPEQTSAPTEGTTSASTEGTSALTEGTTSAPAEETTTAPTEETTTAPAEETTTAPAEETTTAPAEETTSPPAQETTTPPAQETTSPPAQETTYASVQETTSAPAEETSTPAQETTSAPTQETTSAPAEETSTPAQETTSAPAQETTSAPTEETSAPAEETSVPTEETTPALEEETTVPAEETTVPATSVPAADDETSEPPILADEPVVSTVLSEVETFISTEVTEETMTVGPTEPEAEIIATTENTSSSDAENTIPDDSTITETMTQAMSEIIESKVNFVPLPLTLNQSETSSARIKRSISGNILSSTFSYMSLQLQNGMYDSQVARGYELYTQLPKRPFLVDGVSEELVPVMSYTTVFPFDERYKLLLLLPLERRGLRQLIYDLSSCPLREIYQAMRPTRVQAIIPSFMVEGFVILTPTLQQLGIWDVFDPRRANLSGMSNDPDLYVRNIEQAVTVVIRNYVKILDIQT
ncbi:hypothetical protein L9F63_014291, partial [Diploptera punctata]